MTQIVVTLENGADSNFLRRMIENMKGVLKTTVSDESQTPTDKRQRDWIEEMTELSRIVNPAIIDMTDERTRHIMSK